MKKSQSIYFSVFREAAKYYKLHLRKVDPDGCIYSVFNNQKNFKFNLSSTEKNTRIGRVIANNKYLSIQVLKHFKFPVPNSSHTEDFGKFEKFYNKYKDVVVKPLDGSMGKGITVGVKNLRELKQAYQSAVLASKTGRVLIEEFVKGNDHRITVIDGKNVFASKRIPAHIVGDGVKQVRSLILQKNRNRKDNQYPVEIDQFLINLLKLQKVDLKTKLEKGRVVYLKKVANISTGGSSVDVTPEISEYFKSMAIRLAKVMKLGTIGIDLITENISGNRGKIIEINTRPQLMSHVYPDVGTKRYPARAIFKMLFGKTISER